jgi:hypothetical protein
VKVHSLGPTDRRTVTIREKLVEWGLVGQVNKFVGWGLVSDRRLCFVQDMSHRKYILTPGPR